MGGMLCLAAPAALLRCGGSAALWGTTKGLQHPLVQCTCAGAGTGGCIQTLGLVQCILLDVLQQCWSLFLWMLHHHVDYSCCISGWTIAEKSKGL